MKRTIFTVKNDILVKSFFCFGGILFIIILCLIYAGLSVFGVRNMHVAITSALLFLAIALIIYIYFFLYYCSITNQKYPELSN